VALYCDCFPFSGAHRSIDSSFLSLGNKKVQQFVACEQNPATRMKIPDAMRIKGYSQSKAPNQALQMQVRCEVEKMKGEAIPGPPAPAAVAASALLSLASVVTMARPAL
jgi:hypothetical protein